jgi:hypothetical protein
MLVVGMGIGYTLGEDDDEGQVGATAGPAAIVDSILASRSRTTPARTPTETTHPAVTAREQALESRLPTDERPCVSAHETFDGSRAAITCKTSNGVESLYLSAWEGSTAKTGYDAVLERFEIRPGQGADRCPDGAPAEHEWLSAERTVGRIACFESEGRSVIVWTHDPLGVVAVSVGPEGMSGAAHYDWWQTAPRPSISKDELAFYDLVPEKDRPECTFYWDKDPSILERIPPPARSAACSTYLDPSDPLRLWVIAVYNQHLSDEAVDEAYEAERRIMYAPQESGNCAQRPGGEGPWSRKNMEVGRLACTGSRLAWTTKPVRIVATASAERELDYAGLYDWWLKDGGPVYEPPGG